MMNKIFQYRFFVETPYKVLAVLLLACMSLLAACGQATIIPPEIPDTSGRQSGVVAGGGYIQNAVVFLDLNDNNILDLNELRVATDADGKYTLTGLNPDDLSKHRMVARIYPTSISADTGNPVGLDITLKAPVGMGAFISPYTTMVSSLMELDPVMTRVEAETQVAQRLLVSQLSFMAPLDLSQDYVADGNAVPSTTSTTNSLNMHAVANIVVEILARSAEGLNQQSQSFFAPKAPFIFNAMVGGIEDQLTGIANGTYTLTTLPPDEQKISVVIDVNDFIDFIIFLLAANDPALNAFIQDLDDWFFEEFIVADLLGGLVEDLLVKIFMMVI